MRKLAALLAAIPFAAWSQEAPPAEPAPQPQPQYAPPPQQYAPPPQQYAPPSQQPPPGYQPAAPYRRPKQRGSWYIGFGLGAAGGSIKDDSGTYSFKEYLGDSPTSISLNFKIGATLSPRLLLGFDITAASSSVKRYDLVYGPDTTFTAQINNYDAVVTYFPMERGLFVRGGVGFSAFVYQVRNSSGDASDSYSGVNALAGVGYAFWLLKSFNLTVGIDVSAQSYGSSSDAYAPKSSNFWSLGLGFDWY